ncbi:hypothetical protein DSO57_1008016 [Entomophthora muscae]|uniref:Uncharacterized protein n=1 Tax=Entomophthora muscae TaxID=34485 RepID=A0ACC2USN8_9FUNG|nr:hypothetical protein DSO57_1008016 [Entomophthora muscae]
MFDAWLSYFKRSWPRRVGIGALCFLIWLVVSTLTTVKFFNESLDVSWDGYYNSPSDAANPPILHVDFVFRGFNPTTEEASFDFKVTKKEVNPASSQNIATEPKLKPTQLEEIRIFLNGEAQKIFSDAIIKLPLTFTAEKHQDITTYPFDRYVKELTIQARLGEESVFFSFSIKKANKEFLVEYKNLSMNEKTAKFTMSLRRPWFSFFISSFIFVLMWLLALAMMNIAIDTIFHRREMPAEFIAAAFSLVFALPSLREAQPGIPKLGCYIDHIGFLWCLSVISLAACGMLFTWAYRWKPASHSRAFSRSAISFIEPENHKPNSE